MAGSIVDVRQGVRDDGNWRKDKKGVTTSKKKKLTGVCCKRRLDQVVTSTQSFPKSGLQIEISRTRTDKNRESTAVSLFAFVSMVECRRLKFPAITDHRKNSRGHICKMLLRFCLKFSIDDQQSKFQQSKHFLFFVCFFFSSSFLYLSTHTVW